MTPKSKPQRPSDWWKAIAKEHGIVAPVCVILDRGYYRDTMGRKGENDIGIYDDAACILSQDVCATFNANADPSVRRKDIASLVPGVWEYKPGLHGYSQARQGKKGYPYPAFVQAAPVVVYRLGTEHESVGKSDSRGLHLGGGRWKGSFGINLHRGGRNTTSSLGCMTIPPDQWDAFHALLTNELKRNGQTRFQIVLTELPG